jgi:hypothetical protein
MVSESDISVTTKDINIGSNKTWIKQKYRGPISLSIMGNSYTRLSPRGNSQTHLSKDGMRQAGDDPHHDPGLRW